MSSKMPSVPGHRHCIICGKPISLREQVCSHECEETLLRQQRAQRRSFWIFLGVVFFFVLFWILLSVRGGG